MKKPSNLTIIELLANHSSTLINFLEFHLDDFCHLVIFTMFAKALNSTLSMKNFLNPNSDLNKKSFMFQVYFERAGNMLTGP